MDNPYTHSSVDILARTLWGEARGEGRAGMAGVASVVMTRARHPRWWGHDIRTVCLEPWQFSCWNENDPNRPKLMAVTGADEHFVLALDIASAAVAGTLADPTGGADSYFDRSIPAPDWTATATPTTTIGRLSFWRVEI